jgi:hypothetical protein
MVLLHYQLMVRENHSLPLLSAEHDEHKPSWWYSQHQIDVIWEQENETSNIKQLEYIAMITRKQLMLGLMKCRNESVRRISLRYSG